MIKKRGVASKSNKSVFKKGWVLYSKLRPYLNKVIIADEDGICTTEIIPINTNKAKIPIISEYLQIYLMSPYFLSYANQVAHGVKMPRIGTKDAKEALIPIPPIEEQIRISNCYEKLKGLIDAYGKEKFKLKTLETDFPKKLESAILQESMHGRLVPQLEREPIVVQIGEAPLNHPFCIPAKWKWVRLRSVGKIIGGGTPKTNVLEYWENGKIPWYTPADLGKVVGIYAENSARKITPKGLANSSAKIMPANSVLFSSRAPIGYIALAKEDCCTNQGCKSFVADKSFITPFWAYWALKACTKDIIERASGTTFKEISGRGMGDTWIPLPPIEEQDRIVRKLKMLFDTIKQAQ